MKKQADFQPLNEPVPEGLEYRQEYWDSALTMIKARERRVLFWRSAAGALLVLLLGGGMAAHYLWSPSEGLAPATAVRVLPEQAWASNWDASAPAATFDQPTAVAASSVREAGAGATTDAAAQTAAPANAADLRTIAAAQPAQLMSASASEAGASEATSDSDMALLSPSQTPVPLNMNTSTVADDDSLLRFEIASAPVQPALAHAACGQ